MNQVNLIGNLTKETELKYSANGTAMLRNTLAVRRNQEKTDFINIKALGKTAELIANKFSKGSELALVGNIETGSYEKDGKKVYTFDVLVEKITFTRGNKQQEQQESRRQNTPPVIDDPFSNNGGTINISDDDLPF